MPPRQSRGISQRISRRHARSRPRHGAHGGPLLGGGASAQDARRAGLGREDELPPIDSLDGPVLESPSSRRRNSRTVTGAPSWPTSETAPSAAVHSHKLASRSTASVRLLTRLVLASPGRGSSCAATSTAAEVRTWLRRRAAAARALAAPARFASPTSAAMETPASTRAQLNRRSPSSNNIRDNERVRRTPAPRRLYPPHRGRRCRAPWCATGLKTERLRPEGEGSATERSFERVRDCVCTCVISRHLPVQVVERRRRGAQVRYTPEDTMHKPLTLVSAHNREDRSGPVMQWIATRYPPGHAASRRRTPRAPEARPA
jgi:hypothetical protein